MAYELKTEDIFTLIGSLGDYFTKGDELTLKQCPYCKGGNSNDKNTFSINIKNGAFNCLRSSCGKQGHFVELARDFEFKLDNGYEVKKYRTLPQNKKPVPNQFAYDYFQGRGISKEVVDNYRITQSKDGFKNIVFPFYDEKNIMQFIKIRNTEHKKGDKGAKEWCVKDCKPILFGMVQCVDFETLIIAEGQMDSLSIAVCGLKNAVSVPTGAMGFTWLQHCYDWIIKFKKIVVFGDWENGKMSLIDKLRTSLPMPVYSVQEKYYLGEKDANAILTKFGKDAIIQAVENAVVEDINFVRRLSTVESVDIYSMPKIETGIREIDKAIGGIYFGQVVLLSGERGNGKSTFMSQLITNALEQEICCFVYSGELPNYHFKRWLDLQIAGTENIEKAVNEYGDESYYITDEKIQIINKWYHDKMFIFDNSAIEDDEFQGLLQIIIEAICRYGVKLVCIDNLMTALDDDIKSDIYRQQSTFVKKLAKIAKQYGVAIILIAHPKKIQGNFDNDAVSGSGDITNAVDVVMSYGRNKNVEEALDYDSELIITKNRLTGRLLLKENSVKLIYSQSSKRIKSIYDKSNKIYKCFRDKVQSQTVENIESLPF